MPTQTRRAPAAASAAVASPADASSSTPVTPPLRIPRATRRASAKARAISNAFKRGRFDPRKYAIQRKAARKAGATASPTEGKDAAAVAANGAALVGKARGRPSAAASAARDASTGACASGRFRTSANASSPGSTTSGAAPSVPANIATTPSAQLLARSALLGGNSGNPGGPQAAPVYQLPPQQPLVLARPLLREGAEDYRRHPSRLTPARRDAYWLEAKQSR